LRATAAEQQRRGTLHDVTLTDDRLGSVGCPETTLAPGDTVTCYATHTSTTADVDAGRIINTATVTGRPPTEPSLSDSGEETVTLLALPCVPVTG
jgi:hypothetical protein